MNAVQKSDQLYIGRQKEIEVALKFVKLFAASKTISKNAFNFCI